MIRLDASFQLRVSEALLDSIGISDRDLVDLVSSSVAKCSLDDDHKLSQILQSDVGLEADQAAAFIAALKAPPRSKRKPERPQGTSEAKKARVEEENSEHSNDEPKVESLLDDPVLAAKAGRFEKLKDDPVYINQLRTEARRIYLKKRELEQVELAEKLIADREWLYKGNSDLLSEAERRDQELQKKTVEIAKRLIEERKTKGSVEAYVMPESYDEETEKRLAVVRQQWKATELGETPQTFQTEQAVWEAQRQAIASAAKPHVAREKEALAGRKEYKLVEESGAQIEFVPEDALVGTEMDDDATGKEADYNLSQAQRDAKVMAKRETKAKLLQDERKKLPVFNYRSELLKAIRTYPVLIVVGETGSGKTTQIPQYLDEVGYGKLGRIGCTQPRRVAAMSVAARVAEEKGAKLGHEVGYSIRFEDCTTDKTIIKYMTDGMLLREFMTDPYLLAYTAVMVDEAHERTLHTDVLFGLVKDLSRLRSDDFRLIISSATLESEKFSIYFDDAPIFKIPGRRHPVTIYYTKAPEANFLDAAAVTVMQIHLSQPKGSGDILVFLPGQQEIEEVQEDLEKRMRGRGTELGELMVLPIYSTLPSDLQAKIFEPTPEGARKVVLATNIAETSITIENIVYVIDPGFVKQNTYNPKTGMEALVTVPCSKAAVNQRAGRAGRVRPGKCFRLYTKWSYEKELEDSNAPEILRSNLGSVVLSLKAMEIHDLIHFDFMDPPPTETLIKALELLYALAALGSDGELTTLGRRMAEFPIDPMYSKMLISAQQYGCVNECVTIASMLSVSSSVFYCPADKQLHADNARRNFFRPGGDQLTLLNVYNQWEETDYAMPWCFENFIQYRSMKRARDVREQLLELLEKVEVEASSNGGESESIRKAITAGFFSQAARLNRNGTYATLTNRHTVEVHPKSSLFVGDQSEEEKQRQALLPEWQKRKNEAIVRPAFVIYSELVLTTKEYMRNVIEIQPTWLAEMAPHFYKTEELLSELKLGVKRKGR